MANNEGKPKKCFCARCFCPIEQEDQVTIDGQNFHKMCSTCCICRKIPSQLKMYYGHVFCPECFKSYVLNRFKGRAPCVSSTYNWFQFAPGARMPPQPSPQNQDGKENEEEASADPTSTPIPKASKETAPDGSCKAEEAPKRCVCARCLQACDANRKVEIGGQSFHPECARCYLCHGVPTTNVKIYYGQLFCEECFNNYVLGKHKDHPREFFKSCFEQWQNNPEFAENMTRFMTSGSEKQPVVLLASHAPDCPCGGNYDEHEWMDEPRKCA